MDPRGVLVLLSIVVLAARVARAAPASASTSAGASGPLQEQEINLKLRILVPRGGGRDQRAPVVSAAALAPALAQHLAAPMASIAAGRPAFSSQVSLPAVPSMMESVAALPPSSLTAMHSMQPVSVVSSLSAVASGASLTLPRGPAGGQQSYRKLVPVRGYGAPYQALNTPSLVQNIHFQYPTGPRYPTAWTRPRPGAASGAALILGTAAAAPAPPPAPAVPQQTAPAAPRPELINITLIRGGGKAAKACNCSGSNAVSSTTTAAPPPPPPPPPPEEPAPVEEDADDEAPPPPLYRPQAPTPAPDPWQGYIPPDVLEHAKKVLSNNANGRVKLQKEVDKLHFRQNFKHSSYPKKPVPGVGEDLWGALKDDLAELVKDAEMKDVDEDSDALHHRDPDWDDEPLDPIDDVHALGQQRGELDGVHDGDEDDTSGHPYFVDFWGNRVPQYENGFSDASDTVEDSRKEYSNDPHGWNPEYTKGLWSQSDEHLQVFSGTVGQQGQGPQQAQSAPNQVRPVYDNGLGIEANYNKYVLDNGTWVGPDPDPVPDDDLRNVMQDAVSHEPGLQNPSEVYPSYEEVVRYLNSQYRCVGSLGCTAEFQQRGNNSEFWFKNFVSRSIPSATSSSSATFAAPASPTAPAAPATPLPAPLPVPYLPLSPPSNPNLVDVNQLVEALILHKEKERARKQEAAESKEAVEEYEDEDEEGRDVERPVRTSNAHASPPGSAATSASSTTPRSVCKGLKDVGLAPDGQGMSHVQGVVCSSTFDHSEE
ncbi:hypothetical protein KUF71_015497 [Frankliniella fusca]|uniref:Uncharacterized protein n=1 Tax=Frankliniella fusca TaxID=407009 RepID=A0AAE1HTH8_9NEOP|nr:hypothetical protein KUF71_015497 [Frankliniella fusca]